jgi:hypothetical protein
VLRETNPLLFGRLQRPGLADFLTLRRALLGRWGVSDELQAEAGPAIKELFRGDIRMKAAAVRSLVMLDERAASDQRDILLSELNAQLKEEDKGNNAVREPGAGGGSEASPADPSPDAIRPAVPE